MKRLNIEAEGRELILQSDEGHYAIIPVKDRQKVMDMIGCDNCINNYIKSLPKASHYASDGSVIPANKKVQVRQSDNSIREYDINSKEYEDLYNSGHLATYDEATDTYISTPSKEVEVTAKKQYDYKGCVTGLCNSLAEKNNQSVADYRSLNNLYGDAWNIIDNMYGADVDYTNPNNLKINDVVNLTREAFKSDKEKGIPETNQHVGYISKIVNGVPYVKHYISNVGVKSDGKTTYGEYFEEPYNDIKEKYKYTISGAKRTDSNKELDYKDFNFKYDYNYNPNEVERSFANLHKNKKEIQEVLRLTSSEYDELSKVAYGIMGNESSFGRSSRTLYRMAIPDFVQKGVKALDDMIRDTNVYDDNINNLSQGYSSTKESSLHGISKNNIDDKTNTNSKIKEGDYSNLERTNNYLYTAFKKLGINPDNLENGENSGKAILATLAWYKKRFPNATQDDLLRMYTGKKNITKYKQSFESYLKNINNNKNDNLEYSWDKDLYGKLSNIANKTNSNLKDVRSIIASTIRDYSPLPITANAIISDMIGGKEDITEKSLSNHTLDALKKIVKNNISNGKYILDYNSYFPELSRQDRLGMSGGGSSKLSNIEKLKKMMSPEGLLQNFLGQANITNLGNGEYLITDSYDFNDKGKSFGVLDDIKKRGLDPYTIMRSLGRNYGSVDGQGAKVKIRIKIN